MTFAATLADRFEAQARLSRWQADPVSWVQERLGEHVWSKQADILRSVRDNRLTAVQSCHGTGKSFVMSRLVCYYLDAFPPGDFFVITTGPTWAQVRAILWRYIGQVHGAKGLRGLVTQTAEWKIDGELVAYGRKPADHDAAGFQGVRGRRGAIILIDEACGVASQIWDAADSMATTDESRVVAVGNPDTVASRFHKACTTEPGWNRIKISAASSPNFTGEWVPPEVAKSLVRQSWVADKAERWGTRSPLYRIKVDGEFAEDDANALIPLSWAQAAVRRWHDWNDGEAKVTGHEPPGRRVYGVDVALGGEDLTAIATRQGDVVMDVETFAQLDTIAIANIVAARLQAVPQSTSVIDSIGVGAGVLDVLRHRGCAVQPFVASAGTKRRDATSTQSFKNLRGAAWWHLRELLDPALGASLALPDDDDLIADLTTPRWQPVTGGKIVVEEKASVRSRIGRSTDRGDAVVMACWVEAINRGNSAPPARSPVRQYAGAVDWG